ncbi:origin recognition complex subunit 6 [Monosporozyma unispora]|nr:hypothetical protein C6P44_003591 [Kazachstania unispora]
MSSLQIQRCIADVLALDSRGKDFQKDWSQGYLKRLFKATSTLYTTSMNKVPLRSDEETVRGHICALLACEKLREKQLARSNGNLHNDQIIQYYMDRIPLQPKKINHLINVFKQNISQCSPVKEIQWSPSPKKSRSRSQLSSPTKSPIKSGLNKFSSQDPKELRKLLFGGSPKKTPQGKLDMTVTLESPTKSTASSPRRKLKFEMIDDEEEEDGNESKATETETEIESREGSHPPKKRSVSEEASNIDDPFVSPKRQRMQRKSYERTVIHNLLMKKYNKVSPSDVINLCNQFELPQKISYTILDFFMVNQSYLVCPWQLVCGLVLHCTFIVFNDKRRKDPRINHLLLEKMMDLMRCDAVEEISECFNVVSELIVGERWYRDLEIEYNYFSGYNYEESIIIKLGSMLQTNTILFSDDQYENWKKSVLMDLSLKHD